MNFIIYCIKLVFENIVAVFGIRCDSLSIKPMAPEAGPVKDIFGKNDELKVAVENERLKIAELQEVVTYLRKENVLYKQKYNDLKERLGYLNNLLENNAKAFNKLFGDATVALQMGRLSILNSPNSAKKSVSRVTHVPPMSCENQQPGPSQPCTPPPQMVHTRSVHRKLHIEPLNLQEFRREVEQADLTRKPEHSFNASSLPPGSPLHGGGLSTIYEENVSGIRDVVVQLMRLPNEVMKKHLTPSPLSSNTSLNISDLFLPHMHLPSFTSTPSKLETMQQLGLTPSRAHNENCPNNFVSTRRRRTTVTFNTSHTSIGVLSPKKERKSLKRTSLVSPKVEHDVKPSTNSASSPKDTEKKKKKATESNVESKRLTRKARPKALREESLRKKKRRD